MKGLISAFEEKRGCLTHMGQSLSDFIPSKIKKPALVLVQYRLVPLVPLVRQLLLRVLLPLRSQVFFGFSLLVVQFANEMTIHKLSLPI